MRTLFKSGDITTAFTKMSDEVRKKKTITITCPILGTTLRFSKRKCYSLHLLNYTQTKFKDGFTTEEEESLQRNSVNGVRANLNRQTECPCATRAREFHLPALNVWFLTFF